MVDRFGGVPAGLSVCHRVERPSQGSTDGENAAHSHRCGVTARRDARILHFLAEPIAHAEVAFLCPGLGVEPLTQNAGAALTALAPS